MKQLKILHIAMAIPLLGILGLLIRSEYHVQSGSSWRLEIEGYDPRSLIYGHYLRFVYKLNFPATGSTTFNPRRDPATSKVVCFNGTGMTAQLSLIDENADDISCVATLPLKALTGQQRFLIPEQHASWLEDALRERRASVDLIISRSGKHSVGMLYIDDVPWPDMLARAAREGDNGTHEK